MLTPNEKMEKYRQASLEVLIDFDGTLCHFNYPDLGEPREGALEFIQWLLDRGLRPVVWSSRMSRAHNTRVEIRSEANRIKQWLGQHGFPQVDVDLGTVGKRLALAYLDDRGVACDDSTPWDDVKARVAFIHEREQQKWQEYDEEHGS